MAWEKRGAGHIEFVLSFVLFVAVVGFVLLFFKPWSNPSIMQETLVQISKVLDSNLNVSLETYGVWINTTSTGITRPSIGVNISDSVSEVFVVSPQGDVLPSSKQGDIVYFNWEPNEYVYINAGKSVLSSGSVSNFPVHNSSLYVIGAVQKKKILSEEEIIRLKQAYENDYNGLKKALNIPVGIDFAFEIDFGSEKIEMKIPVPVSLEVFSGQKREEVLRKDGSMVFADVLVKVW